MEKTAVFNLGFPQYRVNSGRRAEFCSPTVFCSLAPNDAARRQRDLERKSSADEREPYECTVSEETEIEQKNNKKWRKPQFSTLVFPNID